MEILDKLGIEYERFEHEAVFTCAESEKLDLQFDSPDCKCLFLRNKKPDQYYLVALPSEKRLDLKELKGRLGESKLGFASPERLWDSLGVKPGSVSLLALVNDESRAIKVIIDEDLWAAEKLHFHPLINTATLELRTEDVGKFLRKLGYEPEILEFA